MIGYFLFAIHLCCFLFGRSPVSTSLIISLWRSFFVSLYFFSDDPSYFFIFTFLRSFTLSIFASLIFLHSLLLMHIFCCGFLQFLRWNLCYLFTVNYAIDWIHEWFLNVNFYFYFYFFFLISCSFLLFLSFFSFLKSTIIIQLTWTTNNWIEFN